MARSMAERLSAAAPAVPLVHGVFASQAVSEIERIKALPRRKPINCQRNSKTGRFDPETEALVQVVTEQYSRGPRLSCACRPRVASLSSAGVLTLMRVLPEGFTAEAPLQTTVVAFIAETQAAIAKNQASAAEVDAARMIEALKPGDQITLAAADGEVGHPCIKILQPAQAWTLYEAKIVGGVVGFLGTGSGKTVTWLLAPLVFDDCKLAVLMIEPKQRGHYHSHYLRLREHFRVSSIVFDDGATGYTVPGTPPVHIVSYSKLSNKKSTDIFERYGLDTLILDEAHRATGESSINLRVKRFLAAKIKQREEAIARGEKVRSRAVRLFNGSGTLEAKSVENTQMLCAYALGTGSPLPIDPNEAKAWSAVMDTSYQPDRKSRTAKALQRHFGGGEVEESLDNLLTVGPEKAIRTGFCKHRLHTPGIISASALTINAANYFSERKAPPMPPEVKQALLEVRADWLRPDGDELVESAEQIACARQVGGGFFLYWAFPKHVCVCPVPRTQIKSTWCADCLLISDWYDKRAAFNKELRTKIRRGEVYLDSRKLCEEAAERFWRDPPYKGELPTWDAQSWPEWSAIEGRVHHEERVKWLSTFLAEDAAKWATETKGIVWFKSTALGRKIAEISGLPYHNGGVGGEDRLRAEKGDRSIICSIKALGAGTDGLQHKFNRQLIVESPASNAGNEGYEQLLARLLREGQPKDEIWTDGYFHIRELQDALRKAIAQAEFNREMTNNPQKLLCADMNIPWI